MFGIAVGIDSIFATIFTISSKCELRSLLFWLASGNYHEYLLEHLFPQEAFLLALLYQKSNSQKFPREMAKAMLPRHRRWE